jgi:hypothetical protein
MPSTKTLKYAQAGLRFTTTLGDNDFGIQYFYGRKPRPAYLVKIDGDKLIDLANKTLNTNALDIDVLYNPYHQVGIDWARVIAGFNVRAEAGANITYDLKGDDGSVYNPEIIYSLGFDRDLFWSLNLNIQDNGSVMLFHSKLNDDPITGPLTETEYGKKITANRITVQLSRGFLQDRLTAKVTALWDIETQGFLIRPQLTWAYNDVTAEIEAGFFGGKGDDELGEYGPNGLYNNSYLKLLLKYQF